MEMQYPEFFADRMFRWYEEYPGTSSRTEARIKEVSPCSEYTRFTVEGVLRYPMSGMSALMDVHALGPLFLNSGMKNAKWSERLGYGMGVLREDTRVHLHGNGKFIIRRAEDREHAESAYRTIVSLVKPTLFDLERKRYLWDLLKEVSMTGGPVPPGLGDFLIWPDGIGDPSDVLARSLKEAGRIDERVLVPIRERFIGWLSGVPGADLGASLDDLEADTKELITGYSGSLPDDPDASLGGLTACIWSLRALDELRYLGRTLKDSDVAGSYLGNDTWGGRTIDWDGLRNSLASPGIAISLARVHYLLHPALPP